mmetsp:Transcript_40484/g.48556  ORF Transcript_40484/g.48556 Transcript_40484/m.48556 type:complete len:127 (-) Transcript_40484:267-647(-)
MADIYLHNSILYNHFPPRLMPKQILAATVRRHFRASHGLEVEPSLNTPAPNFGTGLGGWDTLSIDAFSETLSIFEFRERRALSILTRTVLTSRGNSYSHNFIQKRSFDTRESISSESSHSSSNRRR